MRKRLLGVALSACLGMISLCQTGLAQVCQPGSFSTSGSAPCTPCAIGTYQPLVGQSFCLSCPPGTAAGTTGSTACQACTPGSASGVAGAAACQPCAVGTYQSMTQQMSCIPCPAGTYAGTPGSSVCIACQAGTFSSSTGAAACQPCAQGTFQSATGATFCQLCPVGQFGNTTGASVCQACTPGTFSSITGAIACQPCPAGTYSGVSGAMQCLACPAGATCTSTGPVCVGATITSHPQGLTILEGQAAVFGVTVDPSGPAKTYEWRRNGFSLVGVGGFSGAQTPMLTLLSATQADSQSAFDVVVSVPMNVCSTVSRPAGLWVKKRCPVDFDDSGMRTVDDIFVFINAWFAGCP